MMTTSVKIKSDQIQFFAPAKRKRRLERFADHFATAEPPSNQNQSNAILHMSLPFHNEILSSYTWHRSLLAKMWCHAILNLPSAPTFYHQICPHCQLGDKGSPEEESARVTIRSFLPKVRGQIPPRKCFTSFPAQRRAGYLITYQKSTTMTMITLKNQDTYSNKTEA